MYLKNIEIYGFKSFANKITLDFNNGITGIVGPNGSGKSNIADAVRWVLGEQSAKQLRGYKMEDVIFSGTETRKPLSYAYVAITLDNSDAILPIDYHEVTVARRVYRSGESEYLINDSSCRLRDVQELFMDTGIGKEGYSIIGQGQIDKILSGKPEDRRELFDEAAGIVKYKRRKLVAEKSLEQEKQNLYRVTDIINEIEGQLDSLEKQSEQAKIYLRYKEEQKDLEVNSFLLDYNKISENKTKLEEALEIATSNYKLTKENYENTKDEYIKLESEIDELEKSIENLKQNYNELNIQKEKYDGEVNLLNSKIHTIHKNHEFQTNRIHIIEEDIQNKVNEKNIYILEKESLETTNNNYLLEFDLIKANIEQDNNKLKELKTNISDANNENIAINNKKNLLINNINNNKVIIEESNIRKSELANDLLTYKSQEVELLEHITKLNENLLDLEEKSKELLNKIVLTKDKKKNYQNKLDNLNKEIEHTNQNYLTEKSRLDSLINMTERYDGYGNSIRKVMEQKSKVNGIIGVVADVIKVEKQFEIAIETALGGTIQNIITKDESTAKHLIKYLKNNKFGRATFLPLTNIVEPRINDNNTLLKEKGVIDYANNVVIVNKEYKTLAKYLLGRILVVDNIDNASNIARKYGFTNRIVTLEGELLNPGGAISGGMYKNSSNLLGRRNEITELKDLVEKLGNKKNELTSEREVLAQKKISLDNELTNLESIYQKLLLENNSNTLNLETNLSKKEENDKLILSTKNSIKLIEDKIQNINDENKKINIDLSDYENLIRDKEKEVTKDNNILEKLNTALNEMESKYANLNIKISSIKQKIDFSNENISRIIMEISKLDNNKLEINKEIEKSDTDILIIKKDIELNKNNILETTAKIDDIQVNIYNITSKKEKYVLTHKSFFAKREELFENMNLLDKDIYKIKTQLERLDEQLNNLIDYMWNEYELTYIMALEYKRELNLSHTETKKRLSQLKNMIKALGDINVGAIEEYKVKSERFNLLSSQKADIIEAEESLKEIIKLLDIEMKKQFEEHFTLLKKEFALVFSELFGGGVGDLELVDNSEILETGIIINAQPPGKKLQNMMQLSGGEKALTAIALLFAIQNLKPSPFCLLDEIEAALDESNVKRFAKYLCKLTKDTQFIIITHRRGTMTVADTLYGITMHEKGVSTLVSVNLIEDDLDK